jgi:hypothetical protein
MRRRARRERSNSLSLWEGDNILDVSSSPLNWFGFSKTPQARDVIARANGPGQNSHKFVGALKARHLFGARLARAKFSSSDKPFRAFSA